MRGCCNATPWRIHELSCNGRNAANARRANAIAGDTVKVTLTAAQDSNAPAPMQTHTVTLREVATGYAVVSFTAAELEAVIPRLRRYAHALARHPVRPDDLVQDTLERAWAHRRQWRPNTDLRSWLFTILHNTFVSELRRFRVRGYDADPLDDTGRAANEPIDESVKSQDGAMLDIERALTALPIEQRAVVLLVGLEDLSYREAADVLAIPVGTVMSRLSRGRARLRELMEGATPAERPATSPSGESGASLRVVRRPP